MGTLPDTRLSARGVSQQDRTLAASLCPSLALGAGSDKDHPLPRAPRPLCICPRVLAANTSPPRHAFIAQSSPHQPSPGTD